MRNLILGIAIMFPVLISGQDSTFTLKEALEYAVNNSYRSRLARQEVIKSKKKIWETTAIGLPQVAGKVNYQNFPQIPVSLVPAEFFGGPPGEFAEIKFGTEQNVTGEITASQLIFDGTYIVGLQASKTYKLLSQQQMEQTRDEVIEAVAKSYYMVLAAERNRDILEKAMKNTEGLVKETKALYEAGLAEDLDIDQLELTLSRTKKNHRNAQRQVEIMYKVLKFQMGYAVENNIVLSDSLDGILGTSTTKDLLTQESSPESHINYQLSTTQINLAQLNMRKEKMTYLPSLNGFLTHRQNAQRSEFNFTDSDEEWFPTTVWGVNLSIPIFDSGMKLARIQQARADLEKAQVQQEMAMQNIRLKVEQARSNYQSRLDELSLAERNHELAGKILKKTTIKKQEGVATSFEYTQAQNQYLQAQGEYINAIVNTLSAKAELEKALDIY